jgi:hypothetical protein
MLTDSLTTINCTQEQEQQQRHVQRRRSISRSSPRSRTGLMQVPVFCAHCWGGGQDIRAPLHRPFWQVAPDRMHRFVTPLSPLHGVPSLCPLQSETAPWAWLWGVAPKPPHNTTAAASSAPKVHIAVTRFISSQAITTQRRWPKLAVWAQPAAGIS